MKSTLRAILPGQLEGAIGNTTVVLIASGSVDGPDPVWTPFVAIPVAVLLIAIYTVVVVRRGEQEVPPRAMPTGLGLALLSPMLLSTGYAIGLTVSIFDGTMVLLWYSWAIAMSCWLFGVIIEAKLQRGRSAHAR